MRDSGNVRKNVHITEMIMKFCAHLDHRLRYDEFQRQWDSNSVSQVCDALQRAIISKCQYSTKFGNTVHVKFSLILTFLCWLAKQNI